MPGSFRGPGLTNVTWITRQLESNNCSFDLSVQPHFQDLAGFSAKKKYVCSTSSSLKQTCCYFQRTRACISECGKNQTRRIVFALRFCLFMLACQAVKCSFVFFFSLSPAFLKPALQRGKAVGSLSHLPVGLQAHCLHNNIILC